MKKQTMLITLGTLSLAFLLPANQKIQANEISLGSQGIGEGLSKETIIEKTNQFDLSDWTYNETDNQIILTKYLGQKTSIYIPGSHNGKQIVIQKISIIPKTTTQLIVETTDGQKVGLETTSLYKAFSGYTNLEYLDLSGLDVSKVTDFGHFSSNATSLTTIKLDGWDTSSATSMAFMFQNTPVSKLDLKHFNTSKVTTMRGMFASTPNLIDLDIRNWDTSSLTNTWSMFNGATALTSLDLNHFNMSNVTTIYYMFNGMTSLKELYIDKWDTSQVTTMTCTFQGLKSLETLNINDWNLPNLTHMTSTFSGSDLLTFLDLTKWELPNLEKLTDAFLTEQPTPLLLITNEEKLKNYNFHESNRIASKITFDANGGFFSDRNSLRYSDELFTLESSDIITNKQHIEQLLTNQQIPSRDGYTFSGWESSNISSTLTEMYNDVYFAKWTPNNTVPTIQATNQEINLGDNFDPLKDVVAIDTEDGEIQLTKNNIILNTLDSSKVGVYFITYEVIDSQGAKATKTIEVSVVEKEDIMLPTMTFSKDDINDLIQGGEAALVELIYSTSLENEDHNIEITSFGFNEEQTKYVIHYRSINSKGISTPKILSIEIASSGIEDDDTDVPETENPETENDDNVDFLPEDEITQTPNEEQEGESNSNENDNKNEIEEEQENTTTDDLTNEENNKENIETGFSNLITMKIGVLLLGLGGLFLRRKSN